ncbi:EcoAI/FtnUII family type I restriction enzme subunit R [Gloeothece verrucosa]|uniref:Type I site-specific deoxyribonuclease n=1 Tax=Gloeothece verrucosa (strain PCC 7822) TaxID=497965 RepID=E0U642_GLOV7|nr:DEAD/DEAH box helicase family protein [Gloeothece verrucosa]ADN17151.1 Type I site-specific deoxyribonuclease [Gloeothece verrucosa PCC 7822]
MSLNEADTCRKYVLPKLSAWEPEPHLITEQYYIDAGRILSTSKKIRRRRRKKADYLLCYTRDFPLAVVEAKRKLKSPYDGLEQAKEYAELLSLKFAYATNGTGIVEFDYTTGLITEIDSFPSPEELWARQRQAEGLTDEVADKLLTPFDLTGGKIPRYYQRIAINRVIQAILQQQKRLLLTMATGTGKTTVAFQICQKLWTMGWNRDREYRKPRILYLADRNILVDQPMLKDFAVFPEDIIHKIAGEAIHSREIYFAIYQAIAGDKKSIGLYREYSPDFFDFIIVDECHRGSARDESNWRKILEYFQPAYQLGLTATPKRDDNVDTYRYFGNPLYTYSLAQGIGDGFLAPYTVHRVTTTFDAFGWRPNPDELDRYGRTIPDEEYQTPDFERAVALKVRTEAIARHITNFLKKTDRFAKTIVFCVDEPHVQEMVRALNNFNADLARQYPNYVCRITSAAGEVGKEYLYQFQDVLTQTPVIAVTSKLLAIGVDVPTCKNVVLAKVIKSMTDFKQIIGRGTRVEEDAGKSFFYILDYTNSTRLFADPAFDGESTRIETEEMDDEGQTVEGTEEVIENPQAAEDVPEDDAPLGFTGIAEDEDIVPRKYYYDGGQCEVIGEIVYELDPNGNRLRSFKLVDYTKEQVRTLYRSSIEIQQRWIDTERRSEIIEQLGDRGIDFEDLKQVTNQPEADPFDLLCHIAFDAPIMTCKQRAEQLKRKGKSFFEQYGQEARAILEILLENYAQGGPQQFVLPAALKVKAVEERFGNIREISNKFGGAEQLKKAIEQLQSLLYAA